MKVIVKRATLKEGTSKTTNTPYKFTSALVIFDDNMTAENITIDANVCDPKKIEPGIRADLYFSQDGKRVTIFEPIGNSPVEEANASAVNQNSAQKAEIKK